MSYLSILSAAIELAKLVPATIKRLRGVNGGNFAEKLVAIAKNLTNENSGEKAVENLQKNPALVIEFQKLVMEIDAAMYRTSYKEHKNARLRDMEIMKAGRKNIRAHVMVIIAAFGLISCPVALVLSLRAYDNNIPGEIIVIISTIAGIFGSCLKDAYAFEFGSSKSSYGNKSDREFLPMQIVRNAQHKNFDSGKMMRKIFKKVESIKMKMMREMQ